MRRHFPKRRGGWFMQWARERLPRDEHEKRGYQGPRVLGRIAEFMFRQWKEKNRLPHQGAKECARRRRQLERAS